jgi:two-component sensor histidine kinase
MSDSAEDGFGMTLIRSLSEQIRGDLSIRNDAGTTVEVEFPESA